MKDFFRYIQWGRARFEIILYLFILLLLTGLAKRLIAQITISTTGYTIYITGGTQPDSWYQSNSLVTCRKAIQSATSLPYDSEDGRLTN